MIKIQKVFEGDTVCKVRLCTEEREIETVDYCYPADGYIISFEHEGREFGAYIRLSDLASFALSDADITEVDSWRDDG